MAVLRPRASSRARMLEAPRALARAWPRLRWTVITLVFAAWVCACQADAVIDPLPFGTCACGETGGGACPTTVCDLRIEVAGDSCQGELTRLEVMVGDRLETSIWKPGDSLRTCATIERGQSATVFARADTAWQWSEEISCPLPAGGAETEGPTIARVLHCLTGP